MRRQFQRGLCMLLLGLAGSASVGAADVYPSRPIRLILNSTTGGSSDAQVRALAQKMGELLKQPVVVDNRPGADGLVAINAVKGAPADGYTLLATADSISIRAALRQDPGFDLEKDFVGIGQISRAPLVLVTGVDQPDKTFSQFVARARAKPGALTYASSGVGTTSHLPIALLTQQLGLNMLHVPYKGNSAAVPDVMGGRINVMFVALQNVTEGSKLQALGVSSPSRHPNYPDLPTLAEQGAPGFNFHFWVGLVATAGVPKDVIAVLSRTMQAAMAHEDVRKRIVNTGAEVVQSSPEQFTALLKSTMVDISKLAKDQGWPKQ